MSQSFIFRSQYERRLAEAYPYLLDYDSWIVVGSDKVPHQKWKQAEDRLSFEEACARRSEGEYLGFVLAGTPFGLMDGDDLLEDEEYVSDEARDVVEGAPSDGAFSISRSGTHNLFRGEPLAEYETKLSLDTGGKIELWWENQYVLLTGEPLCCDTSLPLRCGDTTYIHSLQQNLGQKCEEREAVPAPMDASPEAQQVIDTIEWYAEHEGHPLSGKASRTMRSFNAPRTGDDTSAEDCRLAALLRFWCRADQHLMEEVFRASARYTGKARREKYLSQHTVGYVLRNNSGEVYRGDYL